MATAKKPAAHVAADESTNTSVNMEQHGFCGETCEIKLFPAQGIEPREPFIGINQYQATLKRDVWIRVPVEVADHLESLIYTVREPDPDQPDDETKFIWVDKPRFPLQRRN